MRKTFKSIVRDLWHNPTIQKFVPAKIYIKIQYKNYTGKRLDLKNPKTFNEKLQWLKLYDRKSEYTNMVDKYEVRKYIAEKIGDEYLIPLLGVWDAFEDIDFEQLPNQFVLKPNHTSGNIYICKDKSEINYEELKKEVNSWLKREYYWVHREWVYKNIKPRIICEEYLGDLESVPNDLKVMCFNGEAKLIELHIARFSKRHTQDFYNVDWKRTKISQGGSFAIQSTEPFPRPTCLNEMLMSSELLAKNIYHVRIDWYEINGRLYFGEITFFDGSGLELFDNEDDDYLLGSWIRLPIDKANQ